MLLLEIKDFGQKHNIFVKKSPKEIKKILLDYSNTKMPKCDNTNLMFIGYLNSYLSKSLHNQKLKINIERDKRGIITKITTQYSFRSTIDKHVVIYPKCKRENLKERVTELENEIKSIKSIIGEN